MEREECALKHLICAALAACSLSWAPVATAVPVVIEFSGTVAVRDGYFSQIPLGSWFSGRIGFDVALTTPVGSGGQYSAISVVACGYGVPAYDATCVGPQPLDHSAVTLLSVHTGFGAAYVRVTAGTDPYAEGLLLQAYGSSSYAIGTTQGTTLDDLGRAMLLVLGAGAGWVPDPQNAALLPDFDTAQAGSFSVQETVNGGQTHSWAGLLNCVRILGDGPAVCDVPAVAEVPEPAAWALVGLGLLALRSTCRPGLRSASRGAGTA